MKRLSGYQVIAAISLVVVLLGLLTRSSPSALAQAPSDGLGDRITETGPSWTGQWTRRSGTTTWDATYQGGSGQPTTMTVTRTGNMLTATRTSSGDGNLCTYQGTFSADGLTVTGQGTCPSGFTFSFTLRLVGPTSQPAPPTTVAPPAPPPPPAPVPLPPPAPPAALGSLSLDAYCQSLEYSVDLGGVTVDIVPYDGAVASGGAVYCAALNVFDSGIDIYSDPIDLSEACAWQYGQTASARREGTNPPVWTCVGS